MSEPKYPDNIDEGIRPVVELLTSHGFETFESCQGGKGHSTEEPFVRFFGDEEDLKRAFEICENAGIKVRAAHRIYRKVDEYNSRNEVIGLMWDIVFNELILVNTTYAMSGKEPKFKVGDKVRVVADTSDHEFKMGVEVTILDIERPPGEHSECAYRCSDGVYTPLFFESDLSPIEEQTNLVAEGSNTDKADVAMLRSGVGNTEEQLEAIIDRDSYEWELFKKWREENKALIAAIKPNKELPVQECDASKADSSTFSPDNNSEKTLTSKDHSSPKEGDYKGFNGEWKNTFENYPDLAKHIERMAATGLVGDIYEWNRFTWALNEALENKSEPKEQVSNWKERFSEEYAICSGESSDLIKWIEENLINQKVPQVSNTDEEILKKLDFDESGSIELQCWDLTKLLEEARQDERNKLEQQLSKAKQEIETLKSSLASFERFKLTPSSSAAHDYSEIWTKWQQEIKENKRLRNLLAEAEQK